MATPTQTLQFAVNALSAGGPSVASRSQLESNAVATCLARAVNAITASNQVNASPPQGFVAQAQLLQVWTSNYAAAFATADLVQRRARVAASQADPGTLPFDTTAATNTTLNSRITAAVGFTPATSVAILGALSAASAALASSFAGVPNQNDTTALAALQASAATQVTAALLDVQSMALYLGVAPIGGT
jgi:hypothetical protein